MAKLLDHDPTGAVISERTYAFTCRAPCSDIHDILLTARHDLDPLRKARLIPNTLCMIINLCMEKSDAPLDQTSMFRKTNYNECQAKLDALDRSLAIIEFAMDGTILHANQNFLDLIGYTIDELKGQHHRIFIEATAAARAFSVWAESAWWGSQGFCGLIQCLLRMRSETWADPTVRTCASGW